MHKRSWMLKEARLNTERELQLMVDEAVAGAAKHLEEVRARLSSAYVMDAEEVARVVVGSFMEQLPDKVIDYFYTNELARLVRGGGR